MSATSEGKRDPATEVRMTIGEHLDELRGCLVRSMLAFVVACLVCIWPAKYLLAMIARPMVLALQAHDQQDSFLQTSPVEGILVYIKVVVIFGLFFSAPYIILQLWRFVAAGLYKNEKKWVRKLVPTSVGLFLVGVVFMYVFVLLLSLNFLIGFSDWLGMPEFEALPWERRILRSAGEERATTQPSLPEMPRIPVLASDPRWEPKKNAPSGSKDPPVGLVWFNTSQRRLKVLGPDQVYSVQFKRDAKRAMMTTHFKIGEYLTFVLVLTIAFGLAFQMPLVVVFLVRSGLVSIATLRGYRKVVYLIIVVIAGMIAPPDLLSHVTLSGPMICLFELGLLIAGRKAKAAAASATSK
jgi:sec-independent protein translocase protein TatC